MLRNWEKLESREEKMNYTKQGITSFSVSMSNSKLDMFDFIKYGLIRLFFVLQAVFLLFRQSIRFSNFKSKQSDKAYDV